MAYFNHAFKKTIVMNTYVAPVAATTTTESLQAGELSLFDARTFLGADIATNPCCQFLIAAGPSTRANDGSVNAALTYAGGNDRVGPFHGGYQASIKSKGIQAKYVNNYFVQNSNAAQQSILHVGTTQWTETGGTGETAGCCPEFLCGENYHLRVDVKGSPALRMLNHQGYLEVTGYGGCCPEDSIEPVAVNPALIMIQWAKDLWASPIVTGNGPNFSNQSTAAAAARVNPNPFFVPVVSVTNNAGVVTGLLYPPGWLGGVSSTTAAAVATATGLSVGNITDWDTYVVPAMEAGICAGLTLVGAYEDTKFGDCTFQPSDFYGLEPLRLFASEVDLNGDPCTFTGICVVNECEGRQAQGLGETAARDVILSESYRQNSFATDLRIREITQGNLMLGSGPGQVDRTVLYDRTMIMHSVPRFNNPSGTFDNDQYIVEVLTPATGPLGVLGIAARDLLRTALATTIISNCGDAACEVEPATSTVACAVPSVPV